MTVSLTAPGRLHFGLFHVPVEGLTRWPDGAPVRQFGGLGLMVEEPAIRSTVERADQWQIDGPLAERAAIYAKKILDALPDRQLRSSAFKIAADGPPEHVGLGVGTALGMSMAMACLRALNISPPDSAHGLAGLVNRGQRSGIGLHGFFSGGFLVDKGRSGSEPPEIEVRVDFPTDWSIVLLRPDGADRWHGERERSAFLRVRSVAEALRTTAFLQTLAATHILPSLRSRDFSSFCSGIAEFNRRAGTPFQRDQGGIYSGPEVTTVIEQLQKWGHVGVGQSSWGPTVFCFVADWEEADSLVDRVKSALPLPLNMNVTRANNTGVRSSEEKAG